VIPRILTLGSVLVVGCVVSLSPARDDRPTAPSPQPKPLSPEKIDQLIGELGSRDFATREAATESLKRRPEAALALMRADRTTSNPEVKRRLQTILPVMMSKEGAEKRLAKLGEYVKKRQIDRLIETMVACREFVTAEHDEHVRTLVMDIFDSATRPKSRHWPAKEILRFRTFAWSNRPGFSESGEPTIVARIAKAGGAGVIASERIEGDSGLRHAIALCNGDINLALKGGLDHTIAIATGRVQIISSDASVIACLGDVEISHGGSTAVIITAGNLWTYGSLGGWRDKTASILRTRERSFFDSWRLYSCTELGGALWSIFGVVGVGAVVPGSVFHRGGIRPGDLLLRIDGRSVSTVIEAHRLLCRATVGWGSTDLTIGRGDHRIQKIVPLCNW
jgi:hypothetical protein